jgi:uncharacterized repeat protein (TIGR02543 family)
MKRISLFLAMFIMAFSAGMVLINCGGTDGGTTTYTVTFDSLGGSPVTAIGGISSGATITLPDVPIKEGYTFGEWFTGKDGTGTQFTANTPVINDITVYAKWNGATKFEGIWNIYSGEPADCKVIFTGNVYLVKIGNIDFKKCSFSFTETTLTETIIDNFGDNGHGAIGMETTVNYTLVDNVFTQTDYSQVFHKQTE